MIDHKPADEHITPKNCMFCPWYFEGYELSFIYRFILTILAITFFYYLIDHGKYTNKIFDYETLNSEILFGFYSFVSMFQYFHNDKTTHN